MQLLMGAINDNYLLNITENAASETHEVIAAVAYATEMSLLFDWCWDNKIPLRFYGRLDESVAVKVPILRQFLRRRSARFQCHLVQHHHAKVIWWRGFGLYVGSANLTQSAWYTNIEAGCYFTEAEITDEMAEDVLGLFKTLDGHSTPLTDELIEVMQKRSERIAAAEPSADEFWKSPSFRTWPGLVQTAKKKAQDRKRQIFLEEWHSTLQQLRDIGQIVSKAENRPAWISEHAPYGAQADQFLHAHYYQRTFDGLRTRYAEFYEQNRGKRDAALMEAIDWWRKLPKAPSEEDVMLNITAPALRSALEEENLHAMDYDRFRQICFGVHSIKDYSRRVANRSVGLLEDGTKYSVTQKVDALSQRIWTDRTAGGNDVKQVLHFILYGGPSAELPERLWLGIHDSKWKLDGLGVSALGELVGWALPDQFPPRNGRTSKSLKSLGYDVTVHVG